MEDKEKVILDMPVSKIRARGLAQFKQYWKALLPIVLLQVVIINAAGYIFSSVSSFLTIIIILAFLPLQVGLGIAILKTARGGKALITDLFFPYKAYFLKSLGVMCLTTLFIFLWSLVGIIPGSIFVGILFGAAMKGNAFLIFLAIVVVLAMCIPAVMAVYRYSQVVYVFINNPELKAMECIEKSKELTAGNKKKLFFLDLSFIGWRIAAAAPLIIAVLFTIGKIKSAILNIKTNIFYGSFNNFALRDVFEVAMVYIAVVIVAAIISALLSVPVDAYNSVAQASAYDILTGKADKDGESKEQPIVEELTDIEKLKVDKKC